jgi:3',5'-cyclic AMP phosphodiesterase CpdA
MANRRFFITKSIGALATLSILPNLNLLGNEVKYPKINNTKYKLRFALVSDGHYGQKNTPFDENYENMLGWINKEYKTNGLDFVIVNGDIVHDRPDLLSVVNQQYFSKFKMPYYAIPGNHDLADAKLWKSVFGYEDTYTFEKQDIVFVTANTSNPKGEFLCPDNLYLKTQLEKFKNRAIVFVVLHIPPTKWLKEEFYNAECEETLNLLHSYPNVKAAFHGHDHAVDGVRYTNNKFPHFFDAHFGGNWGTTYKGYRIVEITHDYKINTYQVNASENPILNSNTL